MGLKILGARWGFRYALVLFIGLLVVVGLWSLQRASRYHDLEAGEVTPTRGYAALVGKKLVLEVANSVRMPDLILWRNTGRLDSALDFPPTIPFWFTWDAARNAFTFYRPDTGLVEMPPPPDWARRLGPQLKKAAEEKDSGPLALTLAEGGNWTVTGRLFPDEPRVVAAVRDMDRLYHQVVPDLLARARRTYPGLDSFTETFYDKGRARSWMSLRMLAGDSLIAGIGVLDEVKPAGYHQRYPLGADYALEISLPRSLDDELRRLHFRLAWALVLVWVLVMALWARAEFGLARARRQLRELRDNLSQSA
ncbi:MAG: hypothetical protein C4524_08660 [Candidatus Zixiibacteriota bacterium]|nr:MAG: hypothetical protein C4524_08660 [candidate division Zixibacteria bacterium]